MREEDVNPVITSLGEDALRELRELVDAMGQYGEPWGTQRGGEETAPGVRQMPWVEMSELAHQAMRWMYGNDRIVQFDWPAWDEGREIFRNWTTDTAQALDYLTVLKLITAIARNDRFNEGAWVEMFEDGQGQPLFSRLLECEELLSSSGA